MNYQHPFSWFAITAAAVIPLSTYAAERVPLQTLPLTQLQQTFHLVLPGKVQANRPSENVLRFIRQHTDNHHITHVRMQQEYAGFPVLGGYAILHSAGGVQALTSSKDVAMTGAIYRNLSAELGAPPPTFIRQGNAALQQFKARYPAHAIHEERVSPMVYIDEHQQAFWAYKVSILLTSEDAMPKRPTAILDAHTYQPFVHWNDIKTIRSQVHGVGYGGNKRTGQYQFGKNMPWLDITRDDIAELCYMENARVKVIDMASHYTGHKEPMTFNCDGKNQSTQDSYWTGYEGDGYDRMNQAYSPSNDALYAGDQISKMYKTWYDTEVLTHRNNPMQLVMRVHFGKNYENAFWDGQQMTFGDGHLMMYPLVSLSVGAHEISHGFTEQYSNLDYYGQSGGMNESFSDMAAQAAQYYAKGQNDWLIGADILRTEDALRYMAHPSRDGHSIDNALQYRPNLNVHYSSGVYNRLFYVLANQPEWNTRTAFHVMLKANMDYWTPASTFSEGACGVLSAGQDLDLPLDGIKLALDAVAIDYQACKI